MTSKARAKDYLENLCLKHNAIHLDNPADVEILTIILNTHAAEARDEQRQICADKARMKAMRFNGGCEDDLSDAIYDACLNATGESDD